MPKNAYRTTISQNEEEPNWDNFLLRNISGHHEQTTAWAKAKKMYGWKPVRIIITKDELIVAGVQILFKSIGMGFNIGFASKGPCFGGPSINLREYLLISIKAVCRSFRIVYLAIDLPYCDNSFLPYMLSEGFTKKPFHFPPSDLMLSTLIIDLKQDLDKIFEGVKSVRRYEIKNGMKSGLIVREGSKNEISTFFKLMLSTCKRRNERPCPSEEEYFISLYQCFNPSGWLRLFIGEYDNKPVVAGIAFCFGQFIRVWKFGWSGKYKKIYPTQTFWWQVIKWAKKNGFKHFDFVQVDPVLAKKMIKGKAISSSMKKSNLYGPTFFKVSFGGEIMDLPGAYAYFYSPLTSSIISKIISGIWENDFLIKKIGKYLA